MNDEMESLRENDTWELADKVANGKQILTNRWVFTIKSDGRYKARLVARGCQQDRDSLDFTEIFSPVVETSSLRALLALAAQQDFLNKTFDVKTAFLYGTLDDEIFMHPPQGYNEEGKICLLKKSLYGLRQAPLRWN